MGFVLNFLPQYGDVDGRRADDEHLAEVIVHRYIEDMFDGGKVLRYGRSAAIACDACKGIEGDNSGFVFRKSKEQFAVEARCSGELGLF